MPFPTIAVTPGTGQTVNTLPNAGPAAKAESLPVVLATDQPALPIGVETVATGFASGQQAVTATAAALPAFACVKGVCVKAAAANAATVYVGPAGVTTTTGFPLAAGESVTLYPTAAAAVYVVAAATGSSVSYLAQ